MAWIDFTLDHARARALLRRLDRIKTPGVRAKFQRNACNAAGGVYKQAAIGASPVRFGFLKASWTVAKWRVKKTNADYAVLVKPNPKYVRYVKDKNAGRGTDVRSFLSVGRSKKIDAAFRGALLTAGKAKDSKRVATLRENRRKFPKARPSKYAHLTEDSVNNPRTRGWLSKTARRVEPAALKKFISNLRASLKGLL